MTNHAIIEATSDSIVFEAFTHPYNQWYSLYQTYYVESIRRHAATSGHSLTIRSMTRAPAVLAAARRLRYSAIGQAVARKAPNVVRWVDGAAAALAGPVRAPGPGFHHAVGQYVAITAGRTVRFCIDSHDTGEVRDPSLCEWSDIYFKTNYWSTYSYPPQVRPLPNCDPLVLPRLRNLIRARTTERRYDICCVVRVWGGKDGIEGTEHNLRLLEAVARAPCRKYILAVLAIGDIDTFAARLRRIGIPWTTHLLSASELWRISSVSRLNVVRLGMHYCIPWRLTGVLALGGVPVLDHSPFTVWPDPLREGDHFLDLGISVGPDAPLGVDSEYAQATQRIGTWLDEEEQRARIGARNASHFDEHLAPERLGAFIAQGARR